MSPTPSQPTSSHNQVSPPAKTRLLPWLIGLPVAFFAVLMVVGYAFSTPEKKERWVARETIRMCWKEQQSSYDATQRKHFSPDDCNKLEFDFKQKYGQNPS